MLKTKRRRWLLVAALFFLAAVGVAIAQVVTAQGEEASGVRHILRTNASGELITAGGTGQVEGTTADGAAFSDNPVVVGGVDAGGNAQQALMDANGRQIITSEAGAPVYVIETVARREGTVVDGGAAAAQRPITVGGVDNAGNVQRILTATSGVVATGETFAAVDGASNAAAGLPVLGTGAGFYQPMFPMHFNGATWDRAFVCSESAAISTVGAGTTEIIALAGTTIIRICHVSISWDAAIDFRLVRGTGANCGTGTANLTDDYQNTTALALDFGVDAALRATAGNAVCMTQTGVGNSGGVVIYAQF